MERWDAWLINEVLVSETGVQRSCRELGVSSKHPPNLVCTANSRRRGFAEILRDSL